MNWYSPVNSDIEQRILDLKPYHYQFLWRDMNGFTYPCPECAGLYVFEIWKNDQLLEYIDELHYPLDVDGIARVETTVTRQWILRQSYR
ncbi:hypothetical protein Q0M94_07450 [Deinococcus radiomollis]|uniref:hypothetical protein n=1 Tax=Deinococcus radiomollis TaxID=468916 RepID=UPI00389265F0